MSNAVQIMCNFIRIQIMCKYIYGNEVFGDNFIHLNIVESGKPSDPDNDMKSTSLQHYLKLFFLGSFSIILVLVYVFLIIWTYCYTLFVCYLLVAAFSACLIIFLLQKSKRQAVKFLLLGLFFFCVLSPFNLRQYNRRAEDLQNKINHKGELSTKEKLGVYGCLLMITVFDIIPFPEAAIQNYYLLFPAKDGQRIFHDQSILKSPSIQRAVKINKKGHIEWNRWNFIHNRDFRYAIAFDPCTVATIEKKDYKEVILTTDFGYRENFVTTHASNFLRGLFTFRVDEGLFFYLQQKGWLHPYKAIWIARSKK
jgi:energy-coupling factor transporter transmembrane protein EcfT